MARNVILSGIIDAFVVLWTWIKWPIRWLWVNMGSLGRWLLTSLGGVAILTGAWGFLFGAVNRLFTWILELIMNPSAVTYSSLNESHIAWINLGKFVLWLVRIDALLTALAGIITVLIGALIFMVIRMLLGFFIG